MLALSFSLNSHKYIYFHKYTPHLHAFMFYSHISSCKLSLPLCVWVCVCVCVSALKLNSDTGSLGCRSDNKRDHTVSRNNGTKSTPPPVEHIVTRGLTDGFCSPAKCSHNWWVSHEAEIGHFSRLLLFFFFLFWLRLCVTHLGYMLCTLRARHNLSHCEKGEASPTLIHVSLCRCV